MARLCLPHWAKLVLVYNWKLGDTLLSQLSVRGDHMTHGWVVGIIWRKDPPNEVQAILPKLLADPKMSSLHEMYGSHIFL